WILGSSASLMRSLGQLRAAVGPMEESLARYKSIVDLHNAVAVCENLSDLYLLLGDIEDARSMSEEGIVVGNQVKILPKLVATRAVHAQALLMGGRIEEARTACLQAEQFFIQTQAGSRVLIEVPGFVLSQVILSKSERLAWILLLNPSTSQEPSEIE